MAMYPRLDDGAAVELLVEMEKVDPASLTDHAATAHPRQYFFTPGAQADEAQLARLREEVLRIAQWAGFPDAGSQNSRTEFDVQVGQRLLGQKIDDAGAHAVWTFLSCVLLPDVVSWRWGWRIRRATERAPLRRYERYLGGHRNALRRCWYRAYQFGWGQGEPVDRVWEDAIVGVEERPSLGADKRVAGMIFRLAAGLFPPSMGYEEREAAFRAGIRSLRERAAVVELSLLSDDDLAALAWEELAGQ